MIELESDADIVKYTPYRIPQSPAQTEQRLQKLLEKSASLEPLGMWAAETKQEKNFIGWFMLLKTEFEFPELGFMIVKKSWNKGYTSEIANALIEYAFKDLKLGGLVARTDDNNAASIHVLKKFGFKKTREYMSLDPILNKEIKTLVFELKSTTL